MIILSRELKSNLRGLLAWTVALAVLSFLMISLYPAFAEDKGSVEELIDMFPPAMIKMFNLDVLSLTSPLGYYGGEIYFFIILFGSIYAAILGAGILAKEEDDGTSEFLLAKPINRSRIIIEKALAWALYLALFNLGIGVATWLAFHLFAVGEYSTTTLISLLLAPFFIHCFFAAVGFFSALFFTRRKSSLSVGIALVLGLYFLNSLASFSAKLEFVAWLTPFQYMNAGDIFSAGGLNPAYALILLALSVAVTAGTAVLYRRRDIL